MPTSNASSTPRPLPSAQANILKASFPAKLHLMLDYAEKTGLSHVVSWLPQGRAFRIHDDGIFMSHVAGRFFKASKMRSIHRQLHIWGFRRVHSGEVHGAWHHEHFTRGQLDGVLKMVRTQYKGGMRRRLPPPPGLLDEAPDSCRVLAVAKEKAEGAPEEEDRSAKAKVEKDCTASTIDMDDRGKRWPHLVSPGVRLGGPSSQLPLDRHESLPFAPTLCGDWFGSHRVSTQTIKPLQNRKVEPLSVSFGDEKAWCDVNEDEFSLFIGLVIKDPSDQ